MKPTLAFVIAAALVSYGCRKEAAENEASAVEASPGNETAPQAAEPTVFCPIVEQRVTKDDCDDLAAIQKNVRPGAAALNVPDHIYRDHAFSVVLVVDRRSPEDVAALDSAANVANTGAVKNEVVSFPSEQNSTVATNEVTPSNVSESTSTQSNPAPTPSQRLKPLGGRTEKFIPQVGRYMTADLYGDAFKIELQPGISRSQEIPSGEQARWEWNVVPTLKGPHHLVLRTAAEGQVSGKSYKLFQTETTKDVTVNVEPMDEFKDGINVTIDWLKRMKVLILAIAGVVGAWYVLMRKLRGKGHERRDQ